MSGAKMERVRAGRDPIGCRRPLRLQTLDDLATEINRLVAAHGQGRLRATGGWTPAQIFWHLAKFIECSFDGFPFRYKHGPVWLSKFLKWMAWRWLVRMALRPGYVNPPEAAIVEPARDVAFDAAATYLLRQVERIHGGERMTQSCSVEGAYDHEQWIYVHLRHAELHLSYVMATEPRP